MNIQLMSLRGKDEDTFLRALRDTVLGRRFIVDCNGTFGIGGVLTMILIECWRCCLNVAIIALTAKHHLSNQWPLST